MRVGTGCSRLATDGLWTEATWWQVVLFTLVTTHITIACGDDLPAPRAGAPRARAARDSVALLPLLAVADHRHGHQGMGGHPPQAPRQVRDRRRPAQPGHARHQDRAADRAPSCTASRPRCRTRWPSTATTRPDDWIERNLYSRYTWQGVARDAGHRPGCCSAPSAPPCGRCRWLWIPVTAAGIINGLGHWWGYRNFEAPDASTNISPWGIIIGGEELHNNHHTYPTSAKLSVKPYEFDIGWVYIRMLRDAGPGQGAQDAAAARSWAACACMADRRTLEALIANRYEVMANTPSRCARRLRRRAGQAEGSQGASQQRALDESAAGAALAAPRRRQDPARREAAAGQCDGRSPDAGQAGGDARGTAPAVDAHQRVGGATGGRPAGLVPQGRGERHRALQEFSLRLRAARAV